MDTSSELCITEETNHRHHEAYCSYPFMLFKSRELYSSVRTIKHLCSRNVEQLLLVMKFCIFRLITDYEFQ